MKKKEKIIVIVGPTGVGKTACSIELAKRLNGEIINGDSMQVYQKLNVGTAKIKKEEQEGIPHHLLDVCTVEESFTASSFQKLAQEAIASISSKGKVPIVVGGTGLYIEGLLYQFQYGQTVGNDANFRMQKQQEMEQLGVQHVWEELKEKDPKASLAIHPNNRHRLIRALEVIHMTGRPFSDQLQTEKSEVYSAVIIGLQADRSWLYERINERVREMCEQGLEEEARWLFELRLSKDNQAQRGIGYKEWYPYFEGVATKEQVIEKIQQESRRYAKRQFTWFKNRMPHIQWYNLAEGVHSLDEVEQMCRQHLNED